MNTVKRNKTKIQYLKPPLITFNTRRTDIIRNRALFSNSVNVDIQIEAHIYIFISEFFITLQ